MPVFGFLNLLCHRHQVGDAFPVLPLCPARHLRRFATHHHHLVHLRDKPEIRKLFFMKEIVRLGRTQRAEGYLNMGQLLNTFCPRGDLFQSVHQESVSGDGSVGWFFSVFSYPAAMSWSDEGCAPAIFRLFPYLSDLPPFPACFSCVGSQMVYLYLDRALQ